MPPSKTTAIVISHNHERYINECLQSIRDQTTQPDRVVFVDDGSSDRSFQHGAEFVERHFADRVLIHHAQPIGLCRGLNEALRASRGDYVHTIAADDYWLPHKTESQVQALDDAEHKPSVVYGDACLIGPDGASLGGTFLQRFAPDGVPADEDLFYRLLIGGNFIPAMSTLIRRGVLVALGGWDEGLFYEDWDMWLRLADRGPFVRQPEVVAAYRVMPSSMSNSRTDDMWLSKLEVAQKWAGTRIEADLGMLRSTAKVTARRAGKRDLRFAREWLRLFALTIIRRLRRRHRPPSSR